MDNIIQVNTAESQTIDVYYQDSVDLELDVQLMYIKSGEAEIQKYVDEVAKPEIDEYVKIEAKPIVAEVVNQIAEPLVIEYVDTEVKPDIDKYVEDKKPEMQKYVDEAGSNATFAAESAANALVSEENTTHMATNAEQSATSSEQSAQSAVQSASLASESAVLAQSWAIGEINTRPEGSAKYWAERAEEFYPVGAIIAYPADEPKKGWLVCDGSTISRTDYAELFAVINTKYGAGDGSKTFNLPNFIDKTFWGGSKSGAVKVAGLPNIVGALETVRNNVAYVGTKGGSGALRPYNTQPNVSGSRENLGEQETGISLDASRSNAIYGRSSTVQPPALQTLIIIKY